MDISIFGEEMISNITCIFNVCMGVDKLLLYHDSYGMFLNDFFFRSAHWRCVYYKFFRFAVAVFFFLFLTLFIQKCFFRSRKYNIFYPENWFKKRCNVWRLRYITYKDIDVWLKRKNSKENCLFDFIFYRKHNETNKEE